MSELARHCQPSDHVSVFQQIIEGEQTPLFNRITDPKSDLTAKTQQPEPSTEAVIRAAEHNARIVSKVLPSIDDINQVLKDRKIDWNAQLQEKGYKRVDDKSVSLGDMLVVSGRELPVVVENNQQRDFIDFNYDNLTSDPMQHWRKSR